MISLQVIGSYQWSSLSISFPDYDQLPYAVWFDDRVYLRLHPGQATTYVVGTNGSVLQTIDGTYPLLSFFVGSQNFITLGSYHGYTGGTTVFILSNGTQEWKMDLATNDSTYPTPSIIAASAAITAYGAVIGLTVKKQTGAISCWNYLIGWDGVSLRMIGSYLSRQSYGADIMSSQLLFALGNRVFAIGIDEQQTSLIRAYLIDTTTFQSVRVEQYFGALSNNISNLSGELSAFRPFFSGFVNTSFEDFAYFTFPSPAGDGVSAMVYEARPRADGLASLKAMEFALPIDFYWTTVAPSGVFISNKDTIYAAHPVSGVDGITTANMLGLERFISPLSFNPITNQLRIVGYKVNQQGSGYIYFLTGSFTFQFQTEAETNLLSPVAGTTIGYPQFTFKPTASAVPSEFELLVESKDRFFARVFASWSSRVGWEYSRDGTSFIRMTGPIVTDGTTIVRFTPPTSLPAGNYRWSVKKLKIGS